ncbi:hypothetical protein PG984_005138 [Apiospora sp. TS-2023a]
MALQTIAVIGGLDVDLIMITSRIPDRGESVQAIEYREALGGKGANCAVATYRACHKKPKRNKEDLNNEQTASERNIHVKMIGAVGDDEYADTFITALNQDGVDTSGIVTVPNTQTSRCFVLLEHPTGENRCLFTPGATAMWKKEDFLSAEQLGGGIQPDLVVAQMEISTEVVETMIETAGKAGIDFCLNAAPATAPIGDRFYQHLTQLMVNESEAAVLSGRRHRVIEVLNEETWPDVAQEFLDRGIRNVVITLGARGAFYASTKVSCHCPAFDVKVKDTTGAGYANISLPPSVNARAYTDWGPRGSDNFIGTYAVDYLRQRARGTWYIRRAVTRATKAAAIKIQSAGAQHGIPWADEIDVFNAPTKMPSRARSRM